MRTPELRWCEGRRDSSARTHAVTCIQCILTWGDKGCCKTSSCAANLPVRYSAPCLHKSQEPCVNTAHTTCMGFSQYMYWIRLDSPFVRNKEMTTKNNTIYEQKLALSCQKGAFCQEARYINIECLNTKETSFTCKSWKKTRWGQKRDITRRKLQREKDR